MLLMKYEIEEKTTLEAGVGLGLEGRNTLKGKPLEDRRMKSQCNFQSVAFQTLKFLLEN